MSIEIDINNLAQVELALRKTPEKINQVLSRAVNRAATNAKSNMSKKVREEYAIKASDIKNAVNITRATTSKPDATVKSAGKKINLAKFRISPTAPRPNNPPKDGYKVQVKKSEGLKVVPRGFLVNSNGGLAFFQRTGSSRMPIKRLMGPAVPEMIGNKSVIEWVENEAQKMLNSRVEHELQRTLGVNKG
jgi:hypothetical protein